jgi:glycosyltransferase involved in cell wall biosynthesis
MIALLGKRDQPTDALRDYCAHLAAALARRNVSLHVADFEWDRQAWPRAFARLLRQSHDWRGEWVVVHYTALAWSSRGFPWRFPRVLRTLRRAGARVAVVFHDSIPATGTRGRDRVRAAIQLSVMRSAYSLAERAIFPLPLDQISWLPKATSKATFIPIGSNILPANSRPGAGPIGTTTSGDHPCVLDPFVTGFRAYPRDEIRSRVAVFGVTGSGRTSREVQDIAAALLEVRRRVGPVSLLVMGRGAEAARSALQTALAGSGVEVEIFGVLPAIDVAQKLAECDAMLFVRGELSPQRGSALAAVACGLPLVGYRGPGTVFPITEAGVELAPINDRSALAEALCRMLQHDAHRLSLRENSRLAYTQHFSWDVITKRYIEVLGL